MKQIYCIFNPKIQTYNDKELDTNLFNQEKKLINDIIPKNYDYDDNLHI